MPHEYSLSSSLPLSIELTRIQWLNLTQAQAVITLLIVLTRVLKATSHVSSHHSQDHQLLL